MRLIIKDYILSLNEETGLNELLPKILLLKGYTVVNTAKKGVRQDGVDILAEKKGCPYLLTMKQGNITRNNWDTGPTSLRQTLNDIIDTYINKDLPKKYNNRKINIIIVLNGEVDQAVQNSLDGYIRNYKDFNFEVWNIDSLTNFVYECLLNENILTEKEASFFRKCLALINDSDFKLNIFYELIDIIFNNIKENKSSKHLNREVNKLIMIQKILCEWNNESNVFLNKIKCCEALLLKITSELLSLNKNKSCYEMLYNSILDIYIEMLEKYYLNAKKIKNTFRVLPLQEDFGVKLKLFEILALLSLYGILLLRKNHNNVNSKIGEIHDLIVNIIENYDGCYYIPLETNCSEISIILLFLYESGDHESAKNYVFVLLGYQRLNYNINKIFPYPYDDYYEAMSNSRNSTTKFGSSVVLENLYEWEMILENANRCKENLEPCIHTFKDVSFQLWTYDSSEELEFYKGNKRIGICYILPKFDSVKNYKKYLLKIYKNIKYKDYISEKKSISYISLIASRLYRMPVNPYLFLKYLNIK